MLIEILAAAQCQFRSRTRIEIDIPCNCLVRHLCEPCQERVNDSRFEESPNAGLRGSRMCSVIKLGGGKSLFGSETDLVINDLFEWTTLVYESAELDNFRVLTFCT